MMRLRVMCAPCVGWTWCASRSVPGQPFFSFFGCPNVACFAEVLKNPGLPDVTDMAACAPFASGCVLHRDLLALKCG